MPRGKSMYPDNEKEKSFYIVGIFVNFALSFHVFEVNLNIVML